MKFDSLYSRIAVVFAAVLIAFGALLGWLSYTAAKVHQHEVMQRLSRDLASHMSSRGPLIGAGGPDLNAVRELFKMAVVVNLMIEVYLLDADGLILANSAPQGRLARERVALAPIHAFMRGDPLPVLGDSPRDASRQDIFSAVPLMIDNRIVGYLYVLLVGGMYRQLADEALQGFAVRSAAWIGAAGLGLALLVGLAAFAKITRPLNRLTRSVQAFEHLDTVNEHPHNEHPHSPERHATGAASGDEISRLAAAFDRMSGQLNAQMRELQRQDGLRRELVANVSHDLRTPLTSMQNHLETLLRIGDDLASADRQRYLEVAVRQSQRVARLVQQLFELAQLECEETLPDVEIFSLSELLQDIAQKFALVAADKAVQLVTTAQPQELFVRGDIGMIETVITNLLDNAISHTPAGGSVSLEAVRSSAAVEVRVVDTGAGIAAEHLPGLFERGSPLRRSARRSGGGLGLRIAGRILVLHGTRISVASEAGRGTTFCFALPAAQPG